MGFTALQNKGAFFLGHPVHIKNVSGCDLVTIMDSVKSKVLIIFRQSLDSEETQAMVRAMESHVERVILREEVTLDIWDLMKYSGQGKCKRVECYGDNVPRYREQLLTWATSNNWTVTVDYLDHLNDENIFYMAQE